MLNSQQFIGNKFVNSIGSLLFGIIVFIGAFVVLYIGETRMDYSNVAQKAVEVAQADEQTDFVYLTGSLSTGQMLGDELYLKRGDYIAVDRIVEMYAWSEESETTENDITTYNYVSGWTENPQDSSSFDSSVFYENPEMKIKSERFLAESVTIGDYLIDMEKVRLPAFIEFKINESNITLGNYETLDTLDGKTYIYDGYATLAEPEIGSIRVSYNVIPAGKKVTLFGKTQGKEFVKHTGEKEKELYRMFYGTKDDAAEILKGEYNTWGWIYKIIGFFAMWLGLGMILKPLSVTMEIIPVLGGLGKSALGIISFIAALILTFVTSFVLGVLNSPVGIILIILPVILIGMYVNSMRSAKQHTKGPGTPPTAL
ncbi:TMEM43 family protein [Candidatus Peregrinibacteria bacterium]|nr:TMEM43 family protein [Candidatus Peregrinibacteria bacterium]